MIPEYSLKGKVALITGAGRGIGTGIAEVLAEAGATVVVNALTDKFLSKFTKELQQRSGSRIVGLTGDVTTPAGASRLVEEAVRNAGDIDILVNNLGDAIRRDLVPPPSETNQEPISDDEIAKVMGLNLMSAIYCTRAVGSSMIKRKGGKVINISSFAGIKGSPHLTIYSIGKTGLSGFTRSLALEWAPYGINVNTIAPGIFPDVLTQGPEGVRRLVQERTPQIPLGRVGNLREAGLLALYLPSDASNYMTGQILPLDGGMTV
jgi:NAD(P)-dependent dehydrogenase (short-subunit alcohol dehydrogenase family)